MITLTRQIESRLVALGASGNGLREKSESLAGRFPPEVEKLLAFIGCIRNRIAHEDQAGISPEELQFFEEAVAAVLAELKLPARRRQNRQEHRRQRCLLPLRRPRRHRFRRRNPPGPPLWRNHPPGRIRPNPGRLCRLNRQLHLPPARNWFRHSRGGFRCCTWPTRWSWRSRRCVRRGGRCFWRCWKSGLWFWRFSLCLTESTIWRGWQGRFSVELRRDPVRRVVPLRRTASVAVLPHSGGESALGSAGVVATDRLVPAGGGIHHSRRLGGGDLSRFPAGNFPPPEFLPCSATLSRLPPLCALLKPGSPQSTKKHRNEEAFTAVKLAAASETNRQTVVVDTAGSSWSRKRRRCLLPFQLSAESFQHHLSAVVVQ